MVTCASNPSSRRVAMTESLGLADKHNLLIEFQTNERPVSKSNLKDLSKDYLLLVSLYKHIHKHTRMHPQANNTGWWVLKV